MSEKTFKSRKIRFFVLGEPQTPDLVKLLMKIKICKHEYTAGKIVIALISLFFLSSVVLATLLFLNRI